MGEHKIDVTLQAVDKASAPLQRITGGFNLLSREGLKAGMMFAATTVAVQGAIQGFQQLRQYIQESTQRFYEFEESMSEVATMLNTMNNDLLPDMTRQITQMSIEYGKSAVDLSRGLYQVLSAGVEAGKAMDVLSSSAKLATATLTSVETAVDAVTTVLNAYNMSAAQAGYVSNMMAKTIQLGKLRMEDLTQALGTVAPIAAQAGVSFEEVSAAIGALTKQGIDADTATMSLRQIINSIIAPSKESTDAMIGMGIAYDDLSLRAMGLQGTLKMISDATGGNISLISQLIPNIRALSGALGLLTNDSRLYGDSIAYISSDFDALNKMYDDVTETSAFFKKQQEQLGESIDRSFGESSSVFDTFFTGIINGFKLIVANQGRPMTALEQFIGKIGEDMQMVNDSLDTEKINEYIAYFDRLNGYINDQSSLIGELQQRQEQYNQDLEDLTKQRDILTQTHQYQEALRYIPLALQDASYETKIFDEATRALIDSIRQQTQEIQRLQDESSRYSLMESKNSLAIMRIQLDAADHRGRLTRAQQKQIDDLNKANLRLQIQEKENSIQEEQIKQDSLNNEQERLDAIKQSYDEQIYIITDSYQQDLHAMEQQMAYKRLLIDDYTTYIETAQADMLTAWNTYYQQLYSLDDRFRQRILGQTTPPAYPTTGMPMTGQANITGQPAPRTQPGLDLPGLGVLGFNSRGNTTARIDVRATVTNKSDVMDLVSKIQQAVAMGYLTGVGTNVRIG